MPKMPPVITELYYEANRLLSRDLMIEHGICDFMRHQTNIIKESTCVGKTYIACAIAKVAIGKSYGVTSIYSFQFYSRSFRTAITITTL